MDRLNQWIAPQYLEDKKISLLKRQFSSVKPFPHIVLQDFFREEKANALRDALLSIDYEKKESDLFSFLQSADLRIVKNTVIKDFVAFYTSTEFKRYIEYLCSEKGIQGIDLSGFVYSDTDYLLPHDDQLQGRKIAYVVNLSKGFTAKDGGQLEFFSTKKKGKEILPVKIVKKFTPSYNTLFLFKVQKNSFHQVAEVTSQKKRVSIGGWFHGKNV